MENLDYLKEYAGTLTLIIGGVSAITAWYMSRTKINLDAKTSVFEQQRLNMEQLLTQNRELAEDLSQLRHRMSEMHEEQLQLMEDIREMKSWYFMRVKFCSDCGLVDEAQRVFGEDRRNTEHHIHIKDEV